MRPPFVFRPARGARSKRGGPLRLSMAMPPPVKVTQNKDAVREQVTTVTLRPPPIDGSSISRYGYSHSAIGRASMRWSDRIGRRVKLRDLHVLLAVAESRSMAKAAERLAISQPVV